MGNVTSANNYIQEELSTFNIYLKLCADLFTLDIFVQNATGFKVIQHQQKLSEIVQRSPVTQSTS